MLTYSLFLELLAGNFNLKGLIFLDALISTEGASNKVLLTISL